MSNALKLAHNALTFAKPMIGALCADSPTAVAREVRNKVYAKVCGALTAIVAEMATPTARPTEGPMDLCRNAASGDDKKYLDNLAPAGVRSRLEYLQQWASSIVSTADIGKGASS